VASPDFSADERSPVILDQAGEWLAQCLTDFRWVKRARVLQRTIGQQTHRIHLQLIARLSRRGYAYISPRLIVDDERMPGSTPRSGRPEVRQPTGWEPAVLNSMFVNFVPFWNVEVGPSSVRIDRPAPHTIGLEAFCFGVDAEIIPVLNRLAEPADLVASLPDTWWIIVGAPTVEWALACGDRDAAAAMIRRTLDAHVRGSVTRDVVLAHFRDGHRSFERDEALTARQTFAIAPLGWLNARHELVDIGA
jgi:hypothetical protein